MAIELHRVLTMALSSSGIHIVLAVLSKNGSHMKVGYTVSYSHRMGNILHHAVVIGRFTFGTPFKAPNGFKPHSSLRVLLSQSVVLSDGPLMAPQLQLHTTTTLHTSGILPHSSSSLFSSSISMACIPFAFCKRTQTPHSRISASRIQHFVAYFSPTTPG